MYITKVTHLYHTFLHQFHFSFPGAAAVTSCCIPVSLFAWDFNCLHRFLHLYSTVCNLVGFSAPVHFIKQVRAGKEGNGTISGETR